MSSNERGMQNKADNNSRSSWEDSRFPILCEGCLGETPYVKMLVEHYANNCRMCDRPYTVFKWRPGRCADFTRTQICQTCSKTRNLCQTCIRDMQLGVPSQLRDAVLHNAEDGSAVRVATADQSEVNREYQTQQQLALINAGLSPYAPGDDPNERLLRLARSVKAERQPANKKLQNLVATIKPSESRTLALDGNGAEVGSESSEDISIPEHIRAAMEANAQTESSTLGQKRKLTGSLAAEQVDLSKFVVASAVASSGHLLKESKNIQGKARGDANCINYSVSSNSKDEASTANAKNFKKIKKPQQHFAPRPPPGPPPPSAFVQ